MVLIMMEIPLETISSFLSLGAKRIQVYRYVLLPASLPDVFTALRLSMGTHLWLFSFLRSRLLPLKGWEFHYGCLEPFSSG